MSKQPVYAERKLTAKQAAFVSEYLIDLNATQAAIRAGYSEKTSDTQASRLLSNVKVSHAVQERMSQRSQRTQVDADYVLNRLHEIDQLDVLDILNDDGTIKSVREWPKSWRTSITGLDVQELMSGDIQSVMKKIKFPDKIRNLELLGRHVVVNAWNADKIPVEPQAINIELVNPHGDQD